MVRCAVRRHKHAVLHAVTSILLTIVNILALATSGAQAGTFACGPYDVCRDTHCGECSKGAPQCNSGEQSQGTSSCSNGCLFGNAKKRRCCAQSTCRTRNDAYNQVFEDVPFTMAVLSNDDAKSGLSITSIANPAHGTAQKSGNNIIFSPDADWHGSDSFSYCARDGSTAGEGCSTVTVQVQPVNDDPDLQATGEIVCDIMEDTSCIFNLTSLVTDRDGDTLTVQGPFGAKNGVVEILQAMELRYTPHLNFDGNDNFTAQVTDGEGGALEVDDHGPLADVAH